MNKKSENVSIKDLLKEYPTVVEIPVAWGEMDAFQHVNNAVYIRYFETGRVAYFEKLKLMGYMEKTGVGPILGAISCRYKAPVTYPDTVSVGVKIAKIESDRLIAHHRVVSHKLQRVVAEGEGVIVIFDYRRNKKAAVPEEIKQRILQMEGAL